MPRTTTPPESEVGVPLLFLSLPPFLTTVLTQSIYISRLNNQSQYDGTWIKGKKHHQTHRTFSFVFLLPILVHLPAARPLSVPPLLIPAAPRARVLKVPA